MHDVGVWLDANDVRNGNQFCSGGVLYDGDCWYVEAGIKGEYVLDCEVD